MRQTLFALCLLVVPSGGFAGPALGQARDTLAAVSARDTLAATVTAATIRVFAPHARDAHAAPTSRPVLSAALDLPGFLGSARAAWTYDFGTPGWPDGWSPFGLDPSYVPLSLDGMPYDDPVTGRPDYAVLPFEQLDTARAGVASRGRIEGVRAELGAFSAPRPRTEMAYRSASTGLQSVSVVHAQERLRTLRGAPVRWQFVFGYGGAGATGEYPGSTLRRKRRVLGRVRLTSERWQIEVGEMFNRHRVGAHGGVRQVTGFTYQSVYQRIGATVDDESARRQTSRNDLWLQIRRPGVRGPITARAWWTVATLMHRDADTTEAHVTRVGALVHQRFALGSDSLDLHAGGFAERYPAGSAWTEAPDARRAWWTSLKGRHRIAGMTVDWSGGFAATYGTVTPTMSVEAGLDVGPVRPFLDVATGQLPSSPADAAGFGASFVGTAASFVGRLDRIEGGASATLGAFSVKLSAFATRQRETPMRLLDASSDTVRVAALDGAYTRLGGRARVTFRGAATHGIYATAEGVAGSGSGASQGTRLDAAVPAVYGFMTLGARATLFKGDLEADAFVRARAWSDHQGYRLHTQTGLLALPDPSTRPLAASAVIDLVFMAGVRDATLFLTLENVLSGTTLIPGNQLVPDYPYPERRLRFGVYWPILD